MKKKTLTLTIIFLISIFMFNSKVEARKAMWLDCDYEVVDKDGNPVEDSELKNTVIVYLGGILSGNKQGDGEIDKYFALNPNEFKENNKFDIAEKFYYPKHIYKMGCWYKSMDDVQDKCPKNHNKDYLYNIVNTINQGYCPEKVILKSSWNWFGLSTGCGSQDCTSFYGVGQKKGTIKYIDTDKYAIGKYDDTVRIIGFTSEGKYFYLTGDQIVILNKTFTESGENGYTMSASGPIYNLMRNSNSNYFNIDSVASSSGLFDEVYAYNGNLKDLKTGIDSWYNNLPQDAPMKAQGTNQANAANLSSKYSSLLNSCKTINENIDNSAYDFSGIDSSKLTNELASFIKELQDYNETEIDSSNNYKYDACYEADGQSVKTDNPVEAAYSCSLNQLIETKNLNFKTEYLTTFPNEVIVMLKNDVEQYLKEKYSYNKVTNDVNSLLKEANACYNSLSENTERFNLSSSDIEQLENINNSITAIADSRGMIVNCETLIGENLRKKINSYGSIVKISVPILLIVFGIIDFAQAVFASDADKMKAAQKKFIQRVIIAIIIFLVPTFVNLLLTLANQVWSNIDPNTCLNF